MLVEHKMNVTKKIQALFFAKKKWPEETLIVLLKI
jgi:hypothetical protein